MFLSVDIGGTFTRIATSKSGRLIDHKEKYPTPQDFEESIDKITRNIKLMVGDYLPRTISVGIPGTVDEENGQILTTPNLPDYCNKPIREILEKKIKSKFNINNDADLAALGETHLGAAVGYQIVGYLTLSTGIGGSRVVNGEIDSATIGFEPGHQIIVPNGDYWPGCGQRGCFESLASGSAFEKIYGVKPENCLDRYIWDSYAKVVGQGLTNLIVFWSPEIVVLGGSITSAGEKFLLPLIKYTEDNLRIFPTPKITISKLQDDNVLLGGMLLQEQS